MVVFDGKRYHFEDFEEDEEQMEEEVSSRGGEVFQNLARRDK